MDSEITPLSPNFKRQGNETTLFLKQTHDPQILHCMSCGAKLIEIPSRVDVAIPGNANTNSGDVEVPTDNGRQVIKRAYIVYCKSSKTKWGFCKAVYLIEGWVS